MAWNTDFLPKPIYESLPWSYVLIGIWGVLALDLWVAEISASLLIAAGMLVLYWRFSYRRDAKAELARRKRERRERRHQHDF
ncbi:MAG: hypothetical protein V7711_09980 [Pseudomonadales bacterium]